MRICLGKPPVPSVITWITRAPHGDFFFLIGRPRPDFDPGGRADLAAVERRVRVDVALLRVPRVMVLPICETNGLFGTWPGGKN